MNLFCCRLALLRLSEACGASGESASPAFPEEPLLSLANLIPVSNILPFKLRACCQLPHGLDIRWFATTGHPLNFYMARELEDELFSHARNKINSQLALRRGLFEQK